MKQFAKLMAVIGLLALAGLAGAQSQAPPKRVDPASLPAHDRHEGLLVATDSCLDAEIAKQIFGKKNPYDAGILAVDVYFRNETAEAMRVNMRTVRLEVEPPGEETQKIESLSAQQVATLIVFPAGSPNPSMKRKFPTGIPMPSHDKKVDKLAEAFKPLELDVDVIPPMGTVHGYLFFDLAHDFKLASSSLLYIPDVHVISGNKALMFYEVALAPTDTPAEKPVENP
jgi:hypothetical protein